MYIYKLLLLLYLLLLLLLLLLLFLLLLIFLLLFLLFLYQQSTGNPSKADNQNEVEIFCQGMKTKEIQKVSLLRQTKHLYKMVSRLDCWSGRKVKELQQLSLLRQTYGYL